MAGLMSFFDQLTCPDCRTPVLTQDTSLICTSCDRNFTIQSGIPRMFPRNHDGFSLDTDGGIDSKDISLIPRWKQFLLSLRQAIRLPSPCLNLMGPKNLKKVFQMYRERFPTGWVLNLGSGQDFSSGIFRFFPKQDSLVINLDISPYPQVSLLADAQNVPFLDRSISVIVSTAVLEHVRSNNLVVKEMERLLVPGGILYVEVPFLQPFHSAPDDYRRYTVKGLEEQFGNFEKIDSGPINGGGSALAAIIPEFLMSFFKNRILRLGIKASARLMFFWLKYLDWLTLKRDLTHQVASGVYFLGIRK